MLPFTFPCCEDLEFSVEKKLNEYSFLCCGFVEVTDELGVN